MEMGKEMDKEMLRSLCDRYGNERGTKLFMKGITLERALHNENVPRDVERLKTRIANETKLLAFDRGEIYLSASERVALSTSNDKFESRPEMENPNKECRRLQTELSVVLNKRDEALRENARLAHQRQLLGIK